MFANQLFGDFSDIKYDDIKIEMKSIFETFSLTRYLQSFSHTLIFIGQIYYFSKAEDFQSKFFLYIISSIILRLLFSLLNYFQLIISQEISQFFIMKKYYEIGDVLKKGILVTIVVCLGLYFPLKFLFQYLLGVLIFNKETLGNILTIQGYICKEKLSNFLYLNFYAMIMYIINALLGDMIFTFNNNTVININSIMRVGINFFCCNYYNQRDSEKYFMAGIAYANIITEAFSLLFLTIAQCFKNPYPEAWVQYNMQIVSLSTFTSIFSHMEVVNLFSFILLLYWDDFFILLYSCISLKEASIKTLSFLFTLMLFKQLFFHIKRKDKEEIVAYYHQIQGSNVSSMFNKLSYEYDSPNQGIKGNFQWMLFIKTKTIGTIVINFIIGIIYVLFYAFGGFGLLNQSIEGWWYIIPFYALNALVEQCAYQTKNIREYLLKKNSLVFIVIAISISITAFILINIFISQYFILLIFAMYIGYYFILFKFYPEIKNVDMRIVNLEMLMYSNNDLDCNYLM